MSVLTRCESVIALIQESNKQQRANKDAEAVRLRLEEIEQSHAALALRLDQLLVLRAKGVQATGAASSVSTRLILREYQEKASQLSDDNGKSFGRMRRSVDKVEKDLAESVKKAVAAVKANIPEIDEAFLRVVETVPGFEAQVASIRKQRDSLMEGSDLNSSPQELSHFLDKRELFSLLVDELKPAEFPKEVIDFFSAVRRGGAPLSKLSPTVRDWMDSRDLTKHIRLSVVAG